MNKQLTITLTLIIMLVCTLTFFIVSLSAMLTTGTINLRFNVFGEGWIEVILSGIGIILGFFYIREYINQSIVELFITGVKK